MNWYERYWALILFLIHFFPITEQPSFLSRFVSRLSTTLSLATYAGLIYGTVKHFKLSINTQKYSIDSNVGKFKYHRICIATLLHDGLLCGPSLSYLIVSGSRDVMACLTILSNSIERPVKTFYVVKPSTLWPSYHLLAFDLSLCDYFFPDWVLFMLGNMTKVTQHLAVDLVD